MDFDNENECPICHSGLNEHDMIGANKCHDRLNRAIYGVLMNWNKKLFDRYLILKEPTRRTNGMHCFRCGCYLPGKWGHGPVYPRDHEYPNAKMCGECLRKIEHNCHNYASHVVIPGSWMGDPSENYWKCDICQRIITVEEFLPRKNINRSDHNG